MAQTETAAAVMALAPNGFAASGADDLAVRVPSAAATPAGPGGPPEASADTELGGDQQRASGESASDNDGSSLPVDNSSGVNVGDSMETDAKRPRSESRREVVGTRSKSATKRRRITTGGKEMV